jgi:glutamyl-tRNA synthetase
MIRTRFAPSPTGFPHIGHLRTAVYSYALARHAKGEFLLRIEDTDRKRYLSSGVESLKNMLLTFGLNWDGYYVQSQRKKQGIYQEAAEKMVSGGHAFYCQCPAKNAKKEGFSHILRDPCRDQKLTSGAIKLKVPDGERIGYRDFVLNKEITWETDTVYDATLLKSDGFPTYHLAAMVDDVQMEVSHILRGHDWLPSTPIHLLVIRYLEGKQPQIGHLTDIMSPDGGKLSKRKGSTTIDSFLSRGYLPEALLNFVILLGWAPKDNREVFSLDEFVRVFDPAGFQKSNPMFLPAKLDWFNGYHIRQKSDTELRNLVKPFVKTKITDNMLTQIIPLIKDRLEKLSDINKLVESFIHFPRKISRDMFASNPEASLLSISNVVRSGDLTDPGLLNSEFKKEITRLGMKTGDYFMNFRVALMGSRFTPPVTESAIIIGKEETLKRIDNALKFLNK